VRRTAAILVITVLMLAASVASICFAPRTPVPEVPGLALNVAGALVGLFLAVATLSAGIVRLLRAMRRLAAGLHPASDDLIPAGHPDLAPLASSLNEVLECARQSASAALDRVREFEIRLKVADAERQHAQAIVYSISDAVLVTDAYDDLILANDSAARAFNFEINTADRTPIDHVLSDATLVALIREMRQSQSHQSRRVVEHTVPSPSGERTYKVTLSNLPGQDQGPSGVVAVLHDMTREKEVARMKNDFVSNVSHELRTPLASIKAYVEMLIDGEAADEKTRSEFYEVIHNEANRLSRLIDNILNISRIESGLVKLNKKPISLTILMKQALEVIRPQARQKDIAIDEFIAPAVYQTLADRDMLYESILNLLSNAVKYTPQGGRITVRADVDESRRLITARIIDTGVGIPPKDLPFVFDKFYRVESNNRMAKGTGLGLSLVKHIVETVHHGRIFAESEVGKGSTFGFELALVD
jgi:two-component system phosphate regulon sensor histidine kinase PhoR